MSSEIEKKIASVRPSLKQFSPLIYRATLGFAVFNFLLGAAMLFYQVSTNDFFIVNEVLSFQFWGTMFGLAGLFQTVALVKNDREWIRASLITGVFLKLWWVLALGLRQLIDLDSNMFLLIMFTFILYIQLCIYFYFDEITIQRKGA